MFMNTLRKLVAEMTKPWKSNSKISYHLNSQKYCFWLRKDKVCIIPQLHIHKSALQSEKDGIFPKHGIIENGSGNPPLHDDVPKYIQIFCYTLKQIPPNKDCIDKFYRPKFSTKTSYDYKHNCKSAINLIKIMKQDLTLILLLQKKIKRVVIDHWCL